MQTNGFSAGPCLRTVVCSGGTQTVKNKMLIFENELKLKFYSTRAAAIVAQ